MNHISTTLGYSLLLVLTCLPLCATGMEHKAKIEILRGQTPRNGCLALVLDCTPD